MTSKFTGQGAIQPCTINIIFSSHFLGSFIGLIWGGTALIEDFFLVFIFKVFSFILSFLFIGISFQCSNHLALNRIHFFFFACRLKPNYKVGHEKLSCCIPSHLTPSSENQIHKTFRWRTGLGLGQFSFLTESIPFSLIILQICSLCCFSHPFYKMFVLNLFYFEWHL